METSINLIFMAGIVTLFVANIQSKEIRRGKEVFGSSTLTKPKKLTTIGAYVGVRQNVDPLRRYFYWRNVLKLLFSAYCLVAIIYMMLLTLSLIEINHVVPAQPKGKGQQIVTTVNINASGTPYDQNRYDLESYLVVAQSPTKEIKAFPVTVEETEGQLVWLSGNGTLTEINVGTALQFFGVMSILLGIATFAVGAILREED